MIYFSYIHSIITYGIIFGGNSTSNIKIFRIKKKKKIRITTNSRSGDFCRYLFKKMKILLLCSQYIYAMSLYRHLFKKMKILPLCSQYIHTMSLYIMNNKHLYTMNMEIRNFNTRYNTNLHPPISNLTKFQKRAYYSGIKIFNHLPANTKSLTNSYCPKKRFLNSKSFYTLEEFLNCDG